MSKPSKRKGVELRGKRVLLRFSYKGAEMRDTLLRRPGETDTQSLDYGEAHRNKILDAITIEERGGKSFDYSEFFPGSKRMGKAIDANGGKLIKEALTEWFDKTGPERSPRTNKKYGHQLKEFVKKWGELTVAELTAGDIQLWVEHSRMSKDKGGLGRSAKTVKNMLRILRGMFQRARIMRDKWELPKDWIAPINDIGAIVDTRAETEERRRRNGNIDPFSFSEMLRIIGAATGDERTFVKFFFGSGARPNEGYGLAWEDSDLIELYADLKRGWIENQLSESLKTEGSARRLPLNELPLALEALKEQKANTFMLRPVDHGNCGELRFVFMNPAYNRPWMDDQEFRRGPWAAILRRAGVRYRPPYQMRHTFAVLSLSAGDTEQWLTGIMGHESTRMLQEHYAKNKWDKEVAELAKQYGVRGFGAVWQKLMEERRGQPQLYRAVS